MSTFKIGQIWETNNRPKQKFEILEIFPDGNVTWKYLNHPKTYATTHPMQTCHYKLIKDSKIDQETKSMKKFIIVSSQATSEILRKNADSVKELLATQIPSHWTDVEVFEIGTGQIFNKTTKWEKKK